MRSAIRLVAVIIATAAGVITAEGHAFLNGAVPPVGGVISTPPQQIRLTFSEGIEPAFSGIQLSTATGQPITTGPAAIDLRDKTQLVLPVPALGRGRYKVTWHVVSVDTHRTDGNYMFEIRP